MGSVAQRGVLAGGLAMAIGLATVLACGDDGGNAPAPECLPELPRDCNIVWQNYDAIWDNAFSSCGSATTGGFCHGAEGQMAGLLMSDKDTAYDSLLGGNDGRARVIPGDPECSTLVQRIESEDAAFQMPPGGRMTAPQRCSIIQWIAQGANRDDPPPSQ